MLLSGLIASEIGWFGLLGEYELAPDELCEYLSLLSMRFKSNLFNLSNSID